MEFKAKEFKQKTEDEKIKINKQKNYYKNMIDNFLLKYSRNP